MYVSIVGSLLLGITLFYGVVNESRIKNQTVEEVEQQGALAMDYITQVLRNATSITTPAAAGTGATLTVVVPVGAQSPTTVNLSGGVLQTDEGASPTVALTNSMVQVSALSFRNLTRPGTPGVVQISFTVTRVNNANHQEYNYSESFTTTAALRHP
jgi:hypothetical protein